MIAFLDRHNLLETGNLLPVESHRIQRVVTDRNIGHEYPLWRFRGRVIATVV